MPNRLRIRWQIYATLLLSLGLSFCFPAGAASAGLKQAPTASGAPAPAAKTLNQKRIHQLYADGDFDGVVAAIDSFTQANKTYGLADSIFIAKHLAVIYAANPATREKGKSYMFRLLGLQPSAKIVDMFVSDEIDRIFEKVREEYQVRQQMLEQDAPATSEPRPVAVDKGTPKADPGEKPPSAGGERDRPKSHSLYWAAGGVIFITAAGAAVYFLYPKKTADKTYDLP